MVESQSCIKDDGVPLVLQLQKGIIGVLMSLSAFRNQRVLRGYHDEVIAESISYVFELEMGEFCTETQVSIMMSTADIAVVALQLKTVVLLLTADISEQSGVNEDVVGVICIQSHQLT